MPEGLRDTDPVDAADVLSMPVEGVLTKGSAEGPLSDAEWNELLSIDEAKVLRIQKGVAEQVTAVTVEQRQVG